MKCENCIHFNEGIIIGTCDITNKHHLKSHKCDIGFCPQPVYYSVIPFGTSYVKRKLWE